METDDPRAALQAPDLARRSAGARDLARVGTWDDLALLAKLAVEDKSPAVRLYTAASGADILARHRGAAGQTALTAEQKEQVHAWVRAADPQKSPGLLMWLSAVADRAAIDRLGRHLTKSADNGVRAAAAMALRRMALSAGPLDEAYLQESVRKWLVGKVPPDVPLEVVRIAGELGWEGFDELISNAGMGTKAQVAVAAEARRQLELRSSLAGWEGVWECDGLDVIEVRDDAEPLGWAAIADGRWWRDGASTPIVTAGTRATIDGNSLRMVFAPRVGAPDARMAAVQLDGQTWWKRDGKALAEWVEANIDGLEPGSSVLLAIGRWLEAQEGVVAARARALVLWKGGDPKGARQILDDLIATKKPRADVWLILGKVCAELKDKPAARAALDEFLDKAPKKGDGRKEAEALRKKLG